MRIAILEIFTGLILSIFAGIFLLEALQFPAAINTRDVGPAAFPLVISILTILFSILMIIIGFLRLKQNDQEKVVVKRSKSIIGAIILSVIYVWAMPIVGYYITTALYIPLLLWITGERNWKTLIFVTIFFGLFAEFGFEILLNVPLP